MTKLNRRITKTLLNYSIHTYLYFITFTFLITFKLRIGHMCIYSDVEIQLWDYIVVVMIRDGTRECRVALATTSWFRLVISYAPLHPPYKAIMSSFQVDFAEHCIIGA